MVLVRPARTEDVPAITDILNSLLDSTTYEWTETRYTVEDRAVWLGARQSAGLPVLVADDDGQAVGWAGYGDFRDTRRWPGYRFTVEHSVHVAPSHWGRGVGRLLMDELMARARRDGKRVMVAAIDGSNDRSIAFHGALGFVEVARMPGVGEKWGRVLDLVLMQRSLADGDGRPDRPGR